MLAVGADGGCLDIFFSRLSFLFLSPSLWETARYRLKNCLKGPLSPKQPTNQPTNRVEMPWVHDKGLYIFVRVHIFFFHQMNTNK